MANRLITVNVYNDPVEANIAKSKLTASGIFCFLANEELMSSPTLRTVIGSVELKVNLIDKAEARRILGLS